MFKTRSTEPERIDTGDYTPDEYSTFLREIKFINRYLGDARALRKSLFREVEGSGLNAFSVLDVACGSGELLRKTSEFARRTRRKVRLTGIDLNELSFAAVPTDLGIFYIRGDAFRLPFADDSFDFAISSLFFHHLADEQIPDVLQEMSRVARRGVFVIDLHRNAAAYYLYKVLCRVVRISPLVSQDGALSIRKGFRIDELSRFGEVTRSAPFRLCLSLGYAKTTRINTGVENS
ncbi:MAG TPA: methyltransferase domain-containing protein [Pyrinomonadaceae bacterium]